MSQATASNLFGLAAIVLAFVAIAHLAGIWWAVLFASAVLVLMSYALHTAAPKPPEGDA